MSAQVTASHTSARPPIPRRPSASERLWVEDSFLANAVGADPRASTIAVHKNSDASNASTIGDETQQSPQSAGSQTFFYSGHNSDSTYGSPVLAENTSPTRFISKNSRSPFKKTSPKRITSKYLNADAPPISPRFSVSAATYKRNTQSKPSFEAPTLPPIRSHASETALSDTYSKARDILNGRNSSNHVRFPSNPSTRLEYIPDRAFCDRAHHDALDRKMGVLENKIDGLVPALAALTQALNSLTNRFDEAAMMNHLNGMPSLRGPEMTVQTPGLTPYGLPTPANDELFRLNSFVTDRSFLSNSHSDCDRPIYGSVSDRGTIRGYGSRTHSRRGSKPAPAIVMEINESSILGPLDTRRSDGSKPWIARSRQQSCFEPDTESEIDDIDEGETVSPARTVTNGSLPSESSPIRLRHKESFNSNSSVRPQPGVLRPSPKRPSLRSAPPPPVKIPAYTSEYTVVAGPSINPNRSNSSSPLKRTDSEEQSLSPATVISGQLDRQISFLGDSSSSPAPLTATLHRSLSHMEDAPTTTLSIPTTPSSINSTLTPIKPLAVRSVTQMKVTSQDSPPHSIAAEIETTTTASSPTLPQATKPALSPAGPAWYFFYGPLTDPTFLAELLHLPEPPVLQRARIHNHALKFFGPFPCAVPVPSPRESAIGPRNENRDAVEGKAWYVSTVEMAEWLRQHESEEFTEVGCEIEFLAGAPAPDLEGGKVSDEWNDDKGASEIKKAIQAAGSRVAGRMFEWRGSGDKLLAAPSI